MKKTLLFIGIVLCFSFKHPFYLSVTELTYSSYTNKGINGTVRLTINDLEDALSKISHQTVDLINIKDSALTKKILQDYLKSRLKIKINQTNLNYTFIGFEHEQDAIWLYIEAPECDKPLKITIENTLLYDYIKEQTNIVHFNFDEKKQSSKLKYPEKILVFDFSK